MSYRSKYGNKPTKIDGIRFASKKEAGRYLFLKEEEKTGRIKALRTQPRYNLLQPYTIGERKVRGIDYVADFEYYTVDDVLVIEDVKGVETDVFKLKRKFFEKLYMIELTII